MDLNVLVFKEDLSIYNLVKESSLVQEENVYFLDTTRGLFSFILNNNIHLVITEREHNPHDGVTLLQDIKAFDPLVDVVLVGEKLGLDKVADLIKKGASDYLMRPVKDADMDRALKQILQKRVLRERTHKLEQQLERKYSFQGLVGRSPYMLENFSLIERVAPYFTCVLITGEVGTGRDTAAQALHNLSPVKNRKLVKFDCIAAPGGHFEPELFGFRGNAFEGAKSDQQGYLRKADKGSLYLDEVSEMPLAFQEKLVPVLEEKRVRPVGGDADKAVGVDVRVIASSSGDLRRLVKKGKFNKELFQYLNKVEIHMPALMERTEDIPILVKHFLGELNKKLHKEVKGVSRRVQKLFRNYEWPGNVKELRDVMERALEATDRNFVDMGDLPEYFQGSLEKPGMIPFIPIEKLSTLDELEKQYILYLLKITDGNMSQTARIMGITRSTLYNKIEKYHIPH